MARHTPGPWALGAQNDALYITAGRAPALSNDYPWHDAPRVAVAKVFDPSEGDALPIDAVANGKLLAAAPDLLGALRAMIAEWDKFSRYGSPIAKSANEAVNAARSVLAKVEAV